MSNDFNLVTKRIIQAMDQPGCFPVGGFFSGKILLRRFEITEHSPIFRSRIVDFTDADFPWPFSIVILIRDGQAIIPQGDTVMEKNDIIYVLLPSESIAEFITFINPAPEKYHNIMIVGSEKIAPYIVETLRNLNKNVTWLDAVDSENDKKLKDVFIKNGIISTDVFIAIACSLRDDCAAHIFLAKQLGVKMTILLIAGEEKRMMDNTTGADLIIFQNDFVGNAFQCSDEAEECLAVKKYFSSDVNITKVVVQKGALATKTFIKDLDIPAHCFFGAVKRNQQVFLVKGETRLYPDDEVLIFSRRVSLEQIHGLFFRRKLFRKAF